MCVSENESVAGLTGSLLARQVTRCSTRTNPAPIGVSEDCEDTPQDHIVSSSLGSRLRVCQLH